MVKQYDLVVIGAGTAAMTAAMRVRAAGKQVAVVDFRPFGAPGVRIVVASRD
jgi:glutathione reductase (NADPH)